MAFNTTLFFLILFSFPFSFQATSEIQKICNNTLYPAFCRSFLKEAPIQNDETLLPIYFHYTLKKSFSLVNDFSILVSQHFEKQEPVSSQPISYALQHCIYVSNITVTHLSTSISVMKSVRYLGMVHINQVHTLLSATVTNVETCYDGLLEAYSSPTLITNDITTGISRTRKLLSVSLALFSIGWVKPTKNYGEERMMELEIGESNIVVNTMVVVSKRGDGNFTTIREAVAAAPNDTKPNTGYFGIHIVNGTYKEYVEIPLNKQYLLMVGDGIDQTVITGNRSHASGYPTFTSATFVVRGTGFVAVNMTFLNTAGPNQGQAVAVKNDADLSVFHRCSFDGYQDTLLTNTMRQFYKECVISGTVDFIFGNAAAVFQDCSIYAKKPLKGQFNAITAQGRTDPNQNTGISLQNCKVNATDELINSNFTVMTYLGRPWKEYSRTVFMQSYLGSLIHPLGWHEWEGSSFLDTLYYAEYNNSGPGSITTQRVNWTGYHIINETIASYFTVSYFIVGDFWLPSTGVPFTPGLANNNNSSLLASI